jgi:UPF0042 nucleotide-binding protein
MKLYIVSGTSGAGKSIALQALEDLGIYCIDNLPLNMLPVLIGQLTENQNRGFESAAVGVDARNLGHDFSRFQSIMEEIERSGLESEIFFLDADSSVLLKRFSETRRRHPLTKSDKPLFEAIKAEREVLRPIAENADWHIDTSRTTIHQLREMIRDRVRTKNSRYMSLLFLSFGFKNGLPADADFVFDVRCLPNPHWDPKLRPYTGRDDEVANFLRSQPQVVKMAENISMFLSDWIPLFEAENRSYMTVAIGCTGGQHRSVFIVESLAGFFKEKRPNVLIRHRELI